MDDRADQTARAAEQRWSPPLPRWINPAWELLPADWPASMLATLRRNGIETWEQLANVTECQALLWPGFGERHLSRLKMLIANSGKMLSSDWVTRPPQSHRVMPVMVPREPFPPAYPRAGVYFVQSGPFIKIGVAVDVLVRFRTLLASNPHSVEPLGWIPAENAVALERRLHLEFWRYRYRFEWFHECLPLVQFIAEHAHSWPTKT